MKRITSFDNGIVIQKFLNGQTMDKIAKETGLSKGTVFNLLQHWKDKLGGIGVEEIREFSSIVRKSGMTIRECAQGFRTAQILKELGIHDEFEELDHCAPKQNILEQIRSETTAWDRGRTGHDLYRSLDHGLAKSRRNKNTLTKNDFHHFIEDIYNNCKKYDIKPSDFIGFIKDLLDSYSSLECEFSSGINKDHDLSLSTGSEDESEKVIYFKRTPNGEYDNDNDFLQHLEIKGDTTTKPTKQTNKPDAFIEIPFISQVSYYINQIKLEHKELEQYRKSLNTEISILENKKSALEKSHKITIDKNNNILAHLQWYDFLKQNLFDNYNINLDEEIIFFSSIINDFKTHNYNILYILKEYKQIQSLRKEINRIQNDINLKAPLLQSLLKQVDSVYYQLDVSRVTMKISWELDTMGFNHKRLKQLYNTIIEITLANNIPIRDAVTKFLNDIEDQYDSKLGFETKIKELSAKIGELKNEIPQYKTNLQVQSLVAPSLLYLMNNGVTNEDIINMSQLVVSFQNNNFLTNISSQSGNTANVIGNNNTEKNSKNEIWKLLINKLRSMQNIDSENVLNINLLNTKKKETEKTYIDPYLGKIAHLYDG